MYVQPLNNGTFTVYEYSLETNPFGHASYEIYLSIKDLEILVEFHLSQILHMYTKICLRHKLRTFWRNWRLFSCTNFLAITFC